MAYAFPGRQSLSKACGNAFLPTETPRGGKRSASGDEALPAPFAYV